MREDEKEPVGLKRDLRVILLIAAVLLSIVFIHPGYSADEGFTTNLNYGLDLEGGSWLQIRLQGAVTQLDGDVEGLADVYLSNALGYPVEITGVSGQDDMGTAGSTVQFITSSEVTSTSLNNLALGESEISYMGNNSEVVLFTTEEALMTQYLSDSLGAEVIPLAMADGNVEYEIRTSVTLEDLEALMLPVGGSVVEDIDGNPVFRVGVRTQTRDMTKEILSEKLNALGLKDIPVRTVGDDYILIDFAGIDLATAKDIAQKPGKFEIRIQTEGNETKHVLYGDDIESVGVPGFHDEQWHTPFRLNSDGALALQQAAIETGATDNPDAHWLYMYLDGNEVYGAPFSYSAANKIREIPIYAWECSTGSGEDSKARAEELQIHLRAGALPVNVELMGSGHVDAALGTQFKNQAVLAGLLALMAVAFVVYRRYHQKEILLPMVGTSISEVIMILGFAAAVGWQMDLAAIAGVIAAIGTGIDHLVIITDEVLHEGKLPTTKVYMERITKAFSIIFAAAATTTIAMSPLVVMGFGALKGFAITTIVGVMIGVLIARPVYGKVIKVVLDEGK